METGTFSRVSPRERRQRILICLLIVAVAATICVAIWKLGGSYARMESDLRAWRKGEMTSAEIKARLDRFILEDDYLRQEWAAKKLIALGVPGSEPIIVSILTDYAGKSREVANLLLNCENEHLSSLARRWAEERGYKVEIKNVGPKATWGRH